MFADPCLNVCVKCTAGFLRSDHFLSVRFAIPSDCHFVGKLLNYLIKIWIMCKVLRIQWMSRKIIEPRRSIPQCTYFSFPRRIIITR